MGPGEQFEPENNSPRPSDEDLALSAFQSKRSVKLGDPLRLENLKTSEIKILAQAVEAPFAQNELLQLAHKLNPKLPENLEVLISDQSVTPTLLDVDQRNFLILPKILLKSCETVEHDAFIIALALGYQSSKWPGDFIKRPGFFSPFFTSERLKQALELCLDNSFSISSAQGFRSLYTTIESSEDSFYRRIHDQVLTNLDLTIGNVSLERGSEVIDQSVPDAAVLIRSKLPQFASPWEQLREENQVEDLTQAKRLEFFAQTCAETFLSPLEFIKELEEIHKLGAHDQTSLTLSRDSFNFLFDRLLERISFEEGLISSGESRSEFHATFAQATNAISILSELAGIYLDTGRKEPLGILHQLEQATLIFLDGGPLIPIDLGSYNSEQLSSILNSLAALNDQEPIDSFRRAALKSLNKDSYPDQFQVAEIIDLKLFDDQKRIDRLVALLEADQTGMWGCFIVNSQFEYIRRSSEKACEIFDQLNFEYIKELISTFPLVQQVLAKDYSGNVSTLSPIDFLVSYWSLRHLRELPTININDDVATWIDQNATHLVSPETVRIVKSEKVREYREAMHAENLGVLCDYLFRQLDLNQVEHVSSVLRTSNLAVSQARLYRNIHNGSIPSTARVLEMRMNSLLPSNFSLLQVINEVTPHLNAAERLELALLYPVMRDAKQMHKYTSGRGLDYALGLDAEKTLTLCHIELPQTLEQLKEFSLGLLETSKKLNDLSTGYEATHISRELMLFALSQIVLNTPSPLEIEYAKEIVKILASHNVSILANRDYLKSTQRILAKSLLHLEEDNFLDQIYSTIADQIFQFEAMCAWNLFPSEQSQQREFSRLIEALPLPKNLEGCQKATELFIALLKSKHLLEFPRSRSILFTKIASSILNAFGCDLPLSNEYQKYCEAVLQTTEQLIRNCPNYCVSELVEEIENAILTQISLSDKLAKLVQGSRQGLETGVAITSSMTASIKESEVRAKLLNYLVHTYDENTALELASADRKSTLGQAVNLLEFVFSRMLEDYSLSERIYGKKSHDHRVEILKQMHRYFWDGTFEQRLILIDAFLVDREFYARSRYDAIRQASKIALEVVFPSKSETPWLEDVRTIISQYFSAHQEDEWRLLIATTLSSSPRRNSETITPQEVALRIKECVPRMSVVETKIVQQAAAFPNLPEEVRQVLIEFTDDAQVPFRNKLLHYADSRLEPADREFVLRYLNTLGAGASRIALETETLLGNLCFKFPREFVEAKTRKGFATAHQTWQEVTSERLLGLKTSVSKMLNVGQRSAERDNDPTSWETQRAAAKEVYSLSFSFADGRAIFELPTAIKTRSGYCFEDVMRGVRSDMIPDQAISAIAKQVIIVHSVRNILLGAFEDDPHIGQFPVEVEIEGNRLLIKVQPVDFGGMILGDWEDFERTLIFDWLKQVSSASQIAFSDLGSFPTNSTMLCRAKKSLISLGTVASGLNSEQLAQAYLSGLKFALEDSKIFTSWINQIDTDTRDLILNLPTAFKNSCTFD